METIFIKKLNKHASTLGYGGWQAGGLHVNQGRSIGWQKVTSNEIEKAIASSITSGINVFDTADAYGKKMLSAQRLGKMLKDVNRNEFIIHGKIGYIHSIGKHSFCKKNIETQLFKLLDALKMDHLDILGLHHCDFGKNNIYLPELIDTLQEFEKKGLIKTIGVRIGHQHTSKKKNMKSSQYIKSHIQLLKQLKPDFCSINGSFIKKNKLPSFHGTWLINKTLHQGLLISSSNNFIFGDTRINHSEFSHKSLTEIRSIVKKHGLSRKEIIRGHLKYAQQLTEKSIIFIGLRSKVHVEELILSSEENIDSSTFNCFNEIINYLEESHV